MMNINTGYTLLGYVIYHVYGNAYTQEQKSEARAMIKHVKESNWQDLSTAMGLIEKPSNEAIGDEVIRRLLEVNRKKGNFLLGYSAQKDRELTYIARKLWLEDN